MPKVEEHGMMRNSNRGGAPEVVVAMLSIFFGMVAWAGPKEDYFKLEEEMENAQEAFMKALDEFEKRSAKPTEGPTPPGELPKMPVDGRKDVLKKMDALAAASVGQPGGSVAAFGAFNWAAMIETDKTIGRFEKLASQYPNEEGMGELLPLLPEFYAESGKPEQWVQVLNQLRKSTKRSATHDASAFATGRILYQSNKVDEAKAMFGIAKASLDPLLSKSARGFLFEIENLQVGKPAPDFRTKTVDGTEISLRLLRGKVVLLNFWASW